MNVLVVGSGGREHALGWKISKSPQVETLFFAPGNAGTASLGKNINLSDDELVEFCRSSDIELTVVGPEAPLAAGIVNKFRAAGLKIFGPTAEAAKLEASKAYAKEIMLKAGVSTARSEVFTNYAEAEVYIKQQSGRLVIKADGLAAGKGVIVCDDVKHALESAKDCLDNSAFGSAGSMIVVEDFLEGEEASAMAIVCGETVVPFAFSQDYKRVFNGQTGPNTGGMGAISPTPVIDSERMSEVVESVFLPVVRQLAKEGINYSGFLYAGLMVSPAGKINVLEFNCRMGDPETQPLMVRTKSDILPLLSAAAEGNLPAAELDLSDEAAVCVVASSKGYPGKADDGKALTIDERKTEEADIFLAGVQGAGDNLVTKGGRILAVVCTGKDVAAAREKAYTCMEGVDFEGMHFRTDIGA